MDLIRLEAGVEINKTNAVALGKSLVNGVVDGDTDALELLAKLKFVELAVEGAIKETIPHAIKSKQLGSTYRDVKFVETSGGKSLKYEESSTWVALTTRLIELQNTPEIVKLKAQINEYQGYLDQALDMKLKALEKMDGSTGELVIEGEVIPVVSYTILPNKFAVTLPK